MENQIPNCFYRVSTKALVLNDEKKFLLVKEDNGLWELPGGGLDFGENPQDGLKRELLEEMGINAKSVSKKPSYFVVSKNLRGVWIANVIYETQVDIQEILNFVPSGECQEARFFSKEEAKKEKLYPNVEAFLQEFDL